jgi:hypothetical protein
LRRRSGLAAVLAGALSSSACPGNLGAPIPSSDGAAMGDGGGGDGVIALDCPNAAAILQASCGSCHLSPPQPIYANLDLLSPGVAARLVGVPAYTGAAGACSGQGNLLNAGTLPATGILIDKIDFLQTCGTGMPFGTATPLSAGDRQCLHAWASGLVAAVGSP